MLAVHTMSHLFRRAKSYANQDLLGPDDYLAILGDSFLKSAYFVFDLENYKISLGQAAYTDESDVQVIGSTVPGAQPASLYVSTPICFGNGSTTSTGSSSVSASLTSSSYKNSTATVSTRLCCYHHCGY
jgi:Eukaryotic aspartyl protease